MTREEIELSIEYLKGIKDNYIEGYGYERHPLPEYYAIENAIKALETLEEFEKAQIITGGRLNGRTYAYKCGLEDGKCKALEQEPKPIVEIDLDYVIKQKYIEREVLDKIRAEIIAESYPEDEESSFCKIVYLKDVLDIIDKYRAESEDKE